MFMTCFEVKKLFFAGFIFFAIPFSGYAGPETKRTGKDAFPCLLHGMQSVNGNFSSLLENEMKEDANALHVGDKVYIEQNSEWVKKRVVSFENASADLYLEDMKKAPWFFSRKPSTYVKNWEKSRLFIANCP